MNTFFSSLAINLAVLFQQYEVCNWCGHMGVPGDGNGIFMDTDYFPGRGFSYSAIPICGGCGGLGIQFSTRDFQDRTDKIGDLRFKFYPMDSFPEPPSVVPYQYLNELLKEVEDLVARYKITSDCYATRLIHPESHARQTLTALEELVQVDLQVLNEDNPDLPVTYAEANRGAMIALYSGKFEKGFQLFESLLEKFPDDSTLWHDYTILQIIINRNSSKIDELWSKSTSKEPKRALHFFQAGKYYWAEKKPYKALEYLKAAKDQPDWAEFQVIHGVDLDDLIGSIEGDIYFSSPYKYVNEH